MLKTLDQERKEEEEGSQVQGLLGQLSETLSQNKKDKKRKEGRKEGWTGLRIQLSYRASLAG